MATQAQIYTKLVAKGMTPKAARAFAAQAAKRSTAKKKRRGNLAR